MNLIEFAPGSEVCIMAMTSHLDAGENFDGPIAVGYYQSEQTEVWIQHQGLRVNIQCEDVDAFCKQLKRAKKLAQEQK